MSRKLATIATFTVVVLAPALALAADASAAATTPTERGFYGIAMALAIGLAAMGGGMGQGRAVAAALEGICRNPNAAEKVNTPMLLGLAFIESLTIFTLVTAFLIYGKFGS